MSTPLQRVVKKLGSQAKLAEAAEVTRGAVTRWNYPLEKKGRRGMIPQQYHQKIVDYAHNHDIILTPEDFCVFV